MNLEAAAMTTVALAALFLLALGTVALLLPASADKFLSAFASSARAHLLEITVRLVVGLGFLGCATLPAGQAFRVIGWVLIATTLAMLCIPWQTHRKFANWAVPRALRFRPLIGVASTAMGAGVLALLAAGGRT